ncbi:MAG: periplasmic heavy metal sensor, partial [Parvibaculum sp.]|nr:periplasmic heavy metal sensor [Parvibaculum sp.]
DSHGPAMMHSAFKALPEEDRQVIRRAMKEQFREVMPHIRESQTARDALTEAIAAEPYDESAVRAAFDDMSRAMTAMTEVGRDAMLDAFARLTPEQRQRVAEAMREERSKMRKRWHDRIEERRSGSGETPPRAE